MPRFFQTKVNLNINDNPDPVSPPTLLTKRLYSRTKSSSNIVVENPTNSLPFKTNSTRIVRIRLVFIRIGEIDTLNEKYQAEIYFEARWNDRLSLNNLNLNLQQQSQLLQERKSIRLNDFNANLFWTPQLFIENAIGQIGEQDKWLTLKKSSVEPSTSTHVYVDICEHRRIKGVFWEKLELNHFPADVQDLTISITSHHHVETCLLIQDEHLRSSINREAFFDQQEWALYEHVATEVRQTNEEYSFDDENSTQITKKHPVLAVTCRAARRPGYYYWNGFCLIFLITVCSFCIFSITPDLPQNRLQITCTLLLTSVTFRWVVNRSLPTISYLTTLDQYAIISIIILVVLCIWHSVIASVTFFNPGQVSRVLHPDNIYVQIDRYVFIVMFAIYILVHIALIIWLIRVPYKRRREMEYLDREYAANKHIQLDTSRSRYESIQTPTQDLVFNRTPSIQSVASMIMMKPPTGAMLKTNDKTTLMANGSTFLPIEEEPKKSTTTMTSDDDQVFIDS